MRKENRPKITTKDSKGKEGRERLNLDQLVTKYKKESYIIEASAEEFSNICLLRSNQTVQMRAGRQRSQSFLETRFLVECFRRRSNP